MKSTILACITSMTLFSALAIPARLAAQEQEHPNKQTHYRVIALDGLGGTFGFASSINNKGWVTGVASLQGDQSYHAALWRRGNKIADLGTLGGPNSEVGFPVKNDRGLIAGFSDTSNPDPLNENFCNLGSGMTCLGFLWQNGVMAPLPTLGGNNGYAAAVNNRGQVAGFAENSVQDPNCIAPQVLDWEAVIWGPKPGEMHELPPLSGDTVAGAVAINDEGQAVGGSGICMSPGPTAHAVLWKSGLPINLGNLGGALHNIAFEINDRGQVIGESDVAGDTTTHAFLWTEDDGMQDLGTLPGDFSSLALGINKKGRVVGQSCDQSGNCRAFLWQDGVMTDLNTLVCCGTSLSLLGGGDINDDGEIAGEALDPGTGYTIAFLAVPSHDGDESLLSPAQVRDKVILPENVRQRLAQRRGLGRFGTGPSKQQ